MRSNHPDAGKGADEKSGMCWIVTCYACSEVGSDGPCFEWHKNLIWCRSLSSNGDLPCPQQSSEEGQQNRPSDILKGMGRSGVRRKSATPTSNSVSAYFSKHRAAENKEPNRPNMAAVAPPGGEDNEPLSKKDLQELRDDLQNYFTSSMKELLQPVQSKLEELMEGLGQVFKDAESAVETAEVAQTEVKMI
ncbi:UNVERIFIED_CONTAM: hypothetical protein K2H54_043450 [Gekko kuhli]